MRKLFTQKIFFIIGFCSLLASQTNAQGTWTALTNLAPDPNNGVMMLMTDGTVICHTTSGGSLGDGTIWDRLTPDSTGNYVNGTWSQIAPMNVERYSFSTAMLKDGRIYAAGGEYGTDGTQNGWHGEVYNPVTNTWTQATGVNSTNVMSDGNCKLLDNGSILQALVDVPNPVHTVVYNPTTNAYTTGIPTLNGQNESMWLKLPDNSVLFVDEGLQSSERFIPSLNQWVADGTVPVALYDPYGSECGPGWMLPNGKAFFIGGTNHTAVYTPSGNNTAGSWVAGPDVPNGYSMPDAPGAMMFNGNILFACSPQPTQATEFATPTKFYEYNYLTNAYTAVAAPSTAATNAISQQYNMLILPNGQVLLGMDQDNSSSQYYVYNPTGSPIAAGKPVITQVKQLTCTTYMITGHGFNGISEGTAFGDENENDSNYPLFRFTSGSRVYYARSYNWNSTGVQRGLKADTAYFQLPASMGAGNYNLYAVVNGIASDSMLFTETLPSLSSPLANTVCSGTAFSYTPTSTTPGATFTWTRAAVTGISNVAITTAQTTNPNEVLVNTTGLPVVVTYAYTITGGGCSNTQNVTVSVNPKPIVAFTAAPTSGCSLPDSVIFTNTTIAGTTFRWTFGDGGISASTSPVHAYTAGGTYTVKLVATSACGSDSLTRASYIAITPPAAPGVTSPVSISCGLTATLSATGTDTLKWFNQATGGTQLGTGTSYITPALHSNTTYYVESYVNAAPSYCPPLTDGFGTGGNYTNSNFRAEVFNVNQPCTLQSVLVYSAAAGNRTIQLQDSAGNVLQSSVVNIPNGTSTVTLNFPLTVGRAYQLGCGDNVTITNLYRNITGAAFPYTDPSGYVTITGNNVPDLVHYYFFYDWKLQGPSCISARTPVTVNVTNNITSQSNITPVTCHGGNNGGATITPSGGTATYTYHWSNNQTGGAISGDTAGVYTVTITDANSCTATATATIPQPNALAITGTVTNVSCSGANTGSIAAGVTGGTSGYQYLWSTAPQQTSDTAKNLTAGPYTVTVTDAHTCTATKNFTVAPATGSLTLATNSTHATCNGSNGTATVTITSGPGTFTYHWNTGTSTTAATDSGLAAGSYTVTVTQAGGCSATATASVSSTGGPTVTHSVGNTTCGNNNGSAHAIVTAGSGPFTYLWSNTLTDSIITGLSSGTYTVTVKDVNGCASIVSATVAASTGVSLTPSATATTCGNNNGVASVTVTNPGSPVYAWNTGGTTASITGLASGTYTVTVTNNGCTATTSVSVAASTGVVLNTSSVPTSCGGGNNGSASVIVTNPSSPVYHWNTGGTTATISNVGPGTYTVTVTNGGCTGTTSVTVAVGSGSLSVTPAVTPVACYGQTNGVASVTVSGGTPNYTYHWAGGQTGDSLTNVAAGNYLVTVTDAGGCSSVSTVTVTQPNTLSATVTTTDPTFGHINGTATVSSTTGGTSPYTEAWSNGHSGQVDSNLAPGTYTVTISDANGCTTIDTFVINKVNGLDNINGGIAFTIYPNPAKTEVVVDMQNNTTVATLELRDVLGQTLLTRTLTAAQTTIDLSAFIDGIYFIEVTQDGMKAVRRLIISR